MGIEDLIVRLCIEEDNKKNDNKSVDVSIEIKANLVEGQTSKKTSKKRKYSDDGPYNRSPKNLMESAMCIRNKDIRLKITGLRERNQRIKPT